jgi:hypothetical protein
MIYYRHNKNKGGNDMYIKTQKNELLNLEKAERIFTSKIRLGETFKIFV